MRYRMRQWRWSLALAVLISLAGGSATATPLGIVLLPEPDINYDFADVSYTAGSGALTVSGFAANMDAFSVTNESIVSGMFNLSATVNNAGVLQVGGTFSVTGTIAAFSFNSGTLLTGNLTAIGFPDGSAGALEFFFDPTGGDAASLYSNSSGITVGIVNGFPGDWDNNFSASFSAVGDIGVPEPSTALMLGLGLGVLSWRRRTSRA